MRILFGLHKNTHSEIGLSEIDAFRKLGAKTHSCQYGNWGVANNVFSSFRLVMRNAFELKRNAALQNSEIVYLNTALDTKTLVRDSITIFILKRFNRNIRIVLKFHGSDGSTLFSKSILRDYVFSRASLLLVLSSEERNNFIKIGVPHGKIRITCNVIDKSLYLQDPCFRKKLDIGDQTGVLLFVGRFIKEKGILDTIEACKSLKETGADFLLLCLGDGPLFMEAGNLINKYGLKSNVRLLGHIPESSTRYYYANCDMLILPTFHQEGFPMAVFQAVGAGKPVITTRIRAAADYLVEYENCLWVEKENPSQLSQKISMLLADSTLKYEMGKRNLVLADQFSSERIVGNLYEFFKAI
jgi:glycosyltransferase involved in cell wall biosynthesis